MLGFDCCRELGVVGAQIEFERATSRRKFVFYLRELGLLRSVEIELLMEQRMKLGSGMRLLREHQPTDCDPGHGGDKRQQGDQKNAWPRHRLAHQQ